MSRSIDVAAAIAPLVHKLSVTARDRAHGLSGSADVPRANARAWGDPISRADGTQRRTGYCRGIFNTSQESPLASAPRPLAIVTGASSGIGRELARLAARRGYDLVISADEPLEDTTVELRERGVDVEAVKADLATMRGVDEVYARVAGRPIAVLMANAGHGLGRGFLDQPFDAAFTTAPRHSSTPFRWRCATSSKAPASPSLV